MSGGNRRDVTIGKRKIVNGPRREKFPTLCELVFVKQQTLTTRTTCRDSRLFHPAQHAPTGIIMLENIKHDSIR